MLHTWPESYDIVPMSPILQMWKLRCREVEFLQEVSQLRREILSKKCEDSDPGSPFTAGWLTHCLLARAAPSEVLDAWFP